VVAVSLGGLLTIPTKYQHPLGDRSDRNRRVSDAGFRAPKPPDKLTVGPRMERNGISW
jgi:hypothetical protein